MKPNHKLRQAVDALYSRGPATIEAYTQLVLTCVRANDIEQAKRLQSHMDLYYFSSNDTFLYNRLLHLYAKSGKLLDAQELFDKMPKRDVMSWNAMLSACGRQIHGRIIVSNLEENAFVWNALTDMYAKCGLMELARSLFNRNKNKNVVSWNSMISGYLKNEQPEKCIHLFDQMQIAGIKPDEVTLSNILQAYFKRGFIDEASKVFSTIKEKDMVCWTTMTVGYAKNGREEDALMLFRNMLLEAVKPDSFTISSVVASCAKLAFLSNGQVVHGKAVLFGVGDNLLVSSSLVDMYCKCGVTKDAWAVFNMMPSRNVVSWNTMIGGYAQNGQELEALALYEKMLQEKVKPDSITFVAVLSACSHGGLVEEGQKYFDSINKVHAVTPSLDHYACMINLLGQSGDMDKAVDLIKTMPQEPDAFIWSTLLSVCTRKGDIKHGEMAARFLFDLQPLNAGPYIMLSNMFAAYRTHPETEIIYEQLSRLIKKLQEAGFSPETKFVLHDVLKEEKLKSICHHSEKLALAFALVRKPHVCMPIRIMKNIRVCGDCHKFMKFVSKITNRPIILRDSNRFHHFNEGKCSCKDYW
ncbi:hypothetical protein SLEP1_g30765 [Rubroshorea leprosula]|uniref:DYW domain-containing protein n=1 Tax=Rubroshorea leprosula TaxID=152421 RepID=A0AAV5K192_9ROSI|nr:hypothetical protein SLEP1_g30765 [Rubroshorea leprosula]